MLQIITMVTAQTMALWAFGGPGVQGFQPKYWENPLTGNGITHGFAYNPLTNTYYLNKIEYNPYTGRYPQGVPVYHPFSNSFTGGVTAYNPFTNKYDYYRNSPINP
jgi:hypothetical protein